MRPEGELIKDLLPPIPAQAKWRPTEDAGNHDQNRLRVLHQAASLRLRMKEKGLSEGL